MVREEGEKQGRGSGKRVREKEWNFWVVDIFELALYLNFWLVRHLSWGDIKHHEKNLYLKMYLVYISNNKSSYKYTAFIYPIFLCLAESFLCSPCTWLNQPPT